MVSMRYGTRRRKGSKLMNGSSVSPLGVVDRMLMRVGALQTGREKAQGRLADLMEKSTDDSRGLRNMLEDALSRFDGGGSVSPESSCESLILQSSTITDSGPQRKKVRMRFSKESKRINQTSELLFDLSRRGKCEIASLSSTRLR